MYLVLPRQGIEEERVHFCSVAKQARDDRGRGRASAAQRAGSAARFDRGFWVRPGTGTQPARSAFASSASGAEALRCSAPVDPVRKGLNPFSEGLPDDLISDSLPVKRPYKSIQCTNLM